MKKEGMSEGVVSNFLRSARHFTPIMVSADFSALTNPDFRGDAVAQCVDGSTKKTGVGMASNPLNHNYEGVTTRSGL